MITLAANEHERMKFVQMQTIMDKEKELYLRHSVDLVLEGRRTITAVYPKGYGRDVRKEVFISCATEDQEGSQFVNHPTFCLSGFIRLQLINTLMKSEQMRSLKIAHVMGENILAFNPNKLK